MGSSVVSSLTVIDDMNRGNHSDILREHECYFKWDYTPRMGFGHSHANNLIYNLKKKPRFKYSPGYHYKQRAIKECSEMFRNEIRHDWLRDAVLVPMPGSKAANDLDYDDRMKKVCEGILPGLTVRNLVKQKFTTRSSHIPGPEGRMKLDELLDVFDIDENEIPQPEPKNIGIFDDVLVKGTHFKAMHQVLSGRFPGARICGFFVARSVRDDTL